MISEAFLHGRDVWISAPKSADAVPLVGRIQLETWLFFFLRLSAPSPGNNSRLVSAIRFCHDECTQ